MGRNSKLKRNNKHETLANDKIRNNIENTGFFVVITNSEDRIDRLEKK
jgi:hypothetical protein